MVTIYYLKDVLDRKYLDVRNCGRIRRLLRKNSRLLTVLELLVLTLFIIY